MRGAVNRVTLERALVQTPDDEGRNARSYEPYKTYWAPVRELNPRQRNNTGEKAVAGTFAEDASAVVLLPLDAPVGPGDRILVENARQLSGVWRAVVSQQKAVHQRVLLGRIERNAD